MEIFQSISLEYDTGTAFFPQVLFLPLLHHEPLAETRAVLIINLPTTTTQIFFPHHRIININVLISCYMLHFMEILITMSILPNCNSSPRILYYDVGRDGIIPTTTTQLQLVWQVLQAELILRE